MATFVKRIQPWHYLATGIMLLSFGGLDVLGHLCRNCSLEGFCQVMNFGRLDTWSAPDFEFSSPTTLLFWAFNQAVPAWIATLLVLKENTFPNYGLIFLGMLVCAPFPFVGLALCIVPIAVHRLYHLIGTGHARMALREIFSVGNCCAIVVGIIPVAYLLSNSRSEGVGLFVDWDLRVVGLFAVFLVLEVGVFLMCVPWRKFPASWLIAMVTSFVLLPMVTIGVKRVFGMRATIPALTILAVCILKVLLDPAVSRARRWFLFGALVIGSLTPIGEMVPVIRTTVAEWPNVKPRDRIGTFNQEYRDSLYKNFWSLHPHEKLFFKYFAKETREGVYL